MRDTANDYPGVSVSRHDFFLLFRRTIKIYVKTSKLCVSNSIESITFLVLTSCNLQFRSWMQLVVHIAFFRTARPQRLQLQLAPMFVFHSIYIFIKWSQSTTKSRQSVSFHQKVCLLVNSFIYKIFLSIKTI